MLREMNDRQALYSEIVFLSTGLDDHSSLLKLIVFFRWKDKEKKTNELSVM